MKAGGIYGKTRPENSSDVNNYRNPVIAGGNENLAIPVTVPVTIPVSDQVKELVNVLEDEMSRTQLIAYPTQQPDHSYPENID